MDPDQELNTFLDRKGFFKPSKSYSYEGLSEKWQKEVQGLQSKCDEEKKFHYEQNEKVKQCTTELNKLKAQNEELLNENNALKEAAQQNKAILAEKLATISKYEKDMEATMEEIWYLTPEIEKLKGQLLAVKNSKLPHIEAIEKRDSSLKEMRRENAQLLRNHEALRDQINALKIQRREREKETSALLLNERYILGDLQNCVAHLDEPVKLRKCLLAIKEKNSNRTYGKETEGVQKTELQILLHKLEQSRQAARTIRGQTESKEIGGKTIKILHKRNMKLEGNCYEVEEKLLLAKQKLKGYKLQEGAQGLAKDPPPNALSKAGLARRVKVDAQSISGATLKGKHASSHGKN